MTTVRIAAWAAGALVVALLAAAIDPVAAFVVVCAFCAVIGLGFSLAAGIRARYRHNVIILGSGLLAAGLALSPQPDRMTWIPGLIALALIAIFIAELVRGEGARHRLESVLSSMTAVLAAVSASGWVVLSAQMQEARESPVLTIVPAIAAAGIIGLVGWRVLGSTPAAVPRRGVASLGVTPVALLGPAVLFATHVAGLVVA